VLGGELHFIALRGQHHLDQPELPIDLEVDALSRWIIVVSIRVGLTVAIVACLEEAHESLSISKTREISVSPRILT